MIKILALLVLIWVFFKAVGMIFRTVLGSSDQNRGGRYAGNPEQRGKKAGDINVDHNSTKKESKGYEGGEYVDYEEVD